MDPRDEPPILGIDLGTSTCLACVMQGDTALFIRPDLAFPQKDLYGLKYSGYLMPSVFCNREGEELTGYRALEQMTDPNYADDVIFDVKSSMKEDESERFPSGGEKYPPSRISGVYVKTLLRAAERQLKLPEHSIQKAVVTVPTAFGSAELGATRRACVQAGLLVDNVWLVDEPVAAAYSLGLHRQPGSQLVLVVDLGGGTFDATLLRVGKDVSAEGFEELGREGNSGVGGRNWDKELAYWVAKNALNDDREVERLLEGKAGHRARHNYLFDICEKAKIDFFNEAHANRGLSFNVAFRVDLEEGHRGRKSPRVPVKAAWFLDRDKSLVDECILVCNRLFDDVARTTGEIIEWKDLNCLYMAGGGSNMWTVRERFAKLWGQEPKVEEPQLAVSKGAALIAQAIHAGRKPKLVGRRRYPNGIGIHTRASIGGPVTYYELVPRSRVLPIDPPLEFRFPPVSSGNGASVLHIPIVERKLTLDGPTEVPVKVLKLRVPPSAERNPDEEIVVRVSCDDEDCQLTLGIEFRAPEVPITLTQEEIKEGTARVNGHPRG